MDTLVSMTWLLISLNTSTIQQDSASREFVGSDTINVADLTGRPVIVHVWATWCRSCVRELRRIEEWWANEQKKSPESRAELLVVSPENKERVREFIKRHRYNLPFYLELTRIPQAYRLKVLPSTFILNEENQIVRRLTGEQLWRVRKEKTDLP